ncbi:ladderlectin-like [Rhinichthys klamathensis goyatoka]|uniref:ladderlectin-like n=1 Tax=Rhinichthys klamathensis goyatoka TaxID=3034132 RepID=UPI0024B5090A|nr:ladderlectin-like [Rhinichthys klamathensis goyatoka]
MSDPGSSESSSPSVEAREDDEGPTSKPGSDSPESVVSEGEDNTSCRSLEGCIKRNCQSLGANLASVRNKLENKFLLSLLPSPSTRTWIGAHDAVQEGQWLWSDGTVFLYTNWWTGEPNNAGVPDNYQGAEDCLEINFSSDRSWNDFPCSSLLCLCKGPECLIGVNSERSCGGYGWSDA